MKVIDDPYGLLREELIKKSGIREVYTPNIPIQSIELFSGRTEEVSKIIECLNTCGQHVLLYGDRGVGKSSLARCACLVLTKNEIAKGNLHIKRCDSNDTFNTIVDEVLTSVGIDINVSTSETYNSVGVNSIVSGGLTKKQQKVGNATKALSPSWVVSKIKDCKGILLIDEFDVISAPEEKQKISEMIKLLSDYGSDLTVFIVGIAETAGTLTGGHPSVNRCLKEIKLDRMTSTELTEIITKGEERLNIKFDLSVKKNIIKLSSGYAYYTHLLALKAAEEAVANSRKVVSETDFKNATNKAANDAEGTLKSAYDNAVRSSRQEEYKNIIISAALCGDDEFSAQELRKQYSIYTKTEISQGGLNNYFGKLINRDDNCILKRIAKGVYRFTDPRMPSYVRIANNLT